VAVEMQISFRAWRKILNLWWGTLVPF